jgi:S-adenosylmethionine-dependent methyltransferase
MKSIIAASYRSSMACSGAKAWMSSLENVSIETARLILRTVTLEDVDAVALSWKLDQGPVSREEATNQVLRMMDNHQQNAPRKITHLCLAIIHKDTQEIIGWCGLDHLDQTRPHPVLFYLLKASYWGQGLATEAARAVLGYAFRELSLPRIDSAAASDNPASVRVMVKLGMRYLGLDAEGGHAFTLTREEYLENTAMDDISDITTMYNRDAEQEHTRLERHQLEYDLTWRYLERHLPSRGTLLEVGAATGRYTLELARRGYQVTAVDLSEVQLERCRQRLVEAGLQDRVQLVVADVRHLDQVTEREFDAVLLMGPLYHLVLEADRKLALQNVINRLKAGGVIISAFISRLGIMGDLIKNIPQWIEERDEVRDILHLGRDPEHYPYGSFRGYFARVDEITPLHEAMGFETLVLAGVEPAISADDESYNRLEGERRKLWLDLLDEISTEPSIIGSSRHLLYVGRKLR